MVLLPGALYGKFFQAKTSKFCCQVIKFQARIHQSAKKQITAAVSWKKSDTQFTLDVTVPVNSTAVVWLPLPETDRNSITILEGNITLKKEGEIDRGND